MLQDVHNIYDHDYDDYMLQAGPWVAPVLAPSEEQVIHDIDDHGCDDDMLQVGLEVHQF